jgi:exosortase/archaeosortase family protein
MTSLAPPSAQPLRRDRRRRDRRGRLPRAIVAAVVVAAVVVGALGNAQYRAVEAFLASALLRPFVDATTSSVGSVIVVSDTHRVFGLDVTAECTALILIAPLLLLAAALLLFGRAPWWRTALGVAAMVTVVTVVNEVRLALIGYSTLRWGIDQGYEISHTFVGSVIGIVGFALGLAVLVLITVGGKRTGRRAGSERAA